MISLIRPFTDTCHGRQFERFQRLPDSRQKTVQVLGRNMFSQRDQVVEQLSAQSPADFELNSHPAATDVADIGGVSARIFRDIDNRIEPCVVEVMADALSQFDIHSSEVNDDFCTLQAVLGKFLTSPCGRGKGRGF